MLAGGEAGPSNIEESRSESRKKSKAGGVPSRPLPVTVCKEVISKLAQDEKWQGWAFDGRKNIYTAKAFMDINQEHNFKVDNYTCLCLLLSCCGNSPFCDPCNMPETKCQIPVSSLTSCMVALVLHSLLQYHRDCLHHAFKGLLVCGHV